MTDDTPSKDEMGYERLAQEALRGVVRSALSRVAEEGMPGAHHFYVTFKTRGVGVTCPPDVVAKYPDEMTIVLQHQFWDLDVGVDGFSVMLKFGGVPMVLAVAYAAVTRFYDPSVGFLLQFDPPALAPEPEPETERSAEHTTPEPISDGPKVVSLDQFRKK